MCCVSARHILRADFCTMAVVRLGFTTHTQNSAAKAAHQMLITAIHAMYIPNGAAIPPMSPLPELSGPLTAKMPATAPTFATTPIAASQPDHREKPVGERDPDDGNKERGAGECRRRRQQEPGDVQHIGAFGTRGQQQSAGDVQSQCNIERRHEHEPGP